MDKAKKKQIKKIVTWVLMAALVAGLAAMPLLAQNEAEADGPVASVLSGKVEQGSVSSSLRGGGTLAVEDTEEIRIPTGVKITGFLVKNGDRVTEGTPLASVDKVSVMTAITSVRETMEYLQKEMKDAKNEKVDSTISATAGGRVKKVYARKGDSVQRIMLEHGALALLSLDGLMAVKIERKMELPTGQSVVVVLSDDREITGRVESNLSGEIVITVEDKGYAIGEQVTVLTNDGDRVGSGELYVHNAWTATAYSGTVQNVQAREESKVSSGATLFTLTDTDFRGDLEYLAALHREYEELMQELFAMYNSGTIDAPCTGMVSGVDKDSAHLLSAGGEADIVSQLLTAEETGYKIVLLSSITGGIPDSGSQSTAVCDPEKGKDCPAPPDGEHDPACIYSCSKGISCGGTQRHDSDCIKSCNYNKDTQTCSGTRYHKNNCILSCQHADVSGGCGTKNEDDPHYLDCIYSCQMSDGTSDCPALKHWSGCIESCTHADTVDACAATGEHYSDCIKSCVSSENGNVPCPASKHKDNCFFCGMTYVANIAKVTAVGSDSLVVKWDSSGAYPVVKTSSGWKLESGKEVDTSLLVSDGATIPVSDTSQFKAGDVVFYLTGYRGENAVWTSVVVYSRASSGGVGGSTAEDSSGTDSSGSMSGFSGSYSFGGMSGGGGSGGMTSGSPVDGDSLFDLNGSVLLTVTPETTVALSINLDEQDIAKVYVGQKAAVRVQALGRETFEAEVVEVSNHGENNGGNSKFAVKLRLAKTHDMIDGMSATAVLEVESRENVLVIPVAALAEQGSRTVVYTALDEKTGDPSKPVEVTLGASDGEYAEILEGLALGDTYYYSYYDILEVDTAA